MAQDFKKVSSGDSFVITANTYNGMVDAAIAFRGNVKNTTVVGQPPIVQPFIFVQNKTADDVGIYSVLGMEGAAIFEPDPSGNQRDMFTSRTMYMKGVKVPADNTVSQFAVTLEPIAPDAIGRAMINGFCFVNVVRDTDNIDKWLFYADFVPDEYHMHMSGYGQAQVIWEETVDDFTVPHLAYVSLGNQVCRLVKATADASAGKITVAYADSTAEIGSNIDFTVYTTP